VFDATEEAEDEAFDWAEDELTYPLVFSDKFPEFCELTPCLFE